jgi:hypothetical protein
MVNVFLNVTTLGRGHSLAVGSGRLLARVVGVIL